MDSTTKFTGPSFVVRDSSGEIHLSSSTSKPSNYHPLVAKAVALQHAMITSNDAGISIITFEGDCQWVVHEVDSDSVCDSVLRPVFHDIRCLLAHNPSWKVKYVSGEANMIAHGLAGLALSLFGENICMEECPPSVMPLVIKNKSLNYLNQ